MKKSEFLKDIAVVGIRSKIHQRVSPIYQVDYPSINTKQETASIHRVIGAARFGGDIEA